MPCKRTVELTRFLAAADEEEKGRKEEKKIYIYILNAHIYHPSINAFFHGHDVGARD